MGPFKKYVTCIIPPVSHFVNCTISHPLCYSVKIINHGMREKNINCIYGCFSVSRYIKWSRKMASLETISFLDTHVCTNNPYWQISGIIIYLCKYYIVISDTLTSNSIRFSCRSVQYYQSFMRNLKGKS